MPNPKHKHSRERRDKRRTQKLRITPPGMSVCPQCHEIKLQHYTCLHCGTYKGKAVIQVASVSSRIRNIAIWRGMTMALSRFWPCRTSIGTL